MISGAHILVNAVAHPHHALATLDLFRVDRADAPLALELAFTFGDDDL